MTVKYIIVTGGVISGLGKGIVTSSIGKLLKDNGYKVSPIKIDPYINIDAGTMRPTEHGETWVTPDGFETDMDLGNYERFMDIDIDKAHSITTGQVYLTVIQRERNLEYKGKNVEVMVHIPEEVIRRIDDITDREKSDFALIEIGGTVGDYQSVLFLEAARQMKLKGRDVVLVHVVYLPIPDSLGEMKSKPAQHSVRELNSIGLQPDFLIARAIKPIDDVRKEKLSMFCNLPAKNIFASPNIPNVYESPIIFEQNGFADMLLSKFNLKYKHAKSTEEWKTFIEEIKNLKREVKIGIVGKYFDSGAFALEDSYVSVIESIKHACWSNKVKPVIKWIDAKLMEKDDKKLNDLKNFDAVIVPGGFGSTGIEGKIKTIKFARENRIPYLGLCYGMQLAVVEFARNVCGMKNANSTEIDEKTPYPVISTMTDQIDKIKSCDYGGSMRLGDQKAVLLKNSLIWKLYGKRDSIVERHRHRYEVNNKYIPQLEQKGLVFSGKSPDGKLMEFMELKDHPYFVGTQAHPEFTSRFMKPNPLFDGLIKAALKK